MVWMQLQLQLQSKGRTHRKNSTPEATMLCENEPSSMELLFVYLFKTFTYDNVSAGDAL
jgi:hypothetical protein